MSVELTIFRISEIIASHSSSVAKPEFECLFETIESIVSTLQINLLRVFNTQYKFKTEKNNDYLQQLRYHFCETFLQLCLSFAYSQILWSSDRLDSNLASKTFVYIYLNSLSAQ